MNWYAIFVETGFEEVVQKLLHKVFAGSVLNAVVPKRKLSERRLGKIEYIYKIMFPGYVFINTNMNTNIYYKLKEIPKIYSLLRNYKVISNRISYKEFNKNNNLSSVENEYFRFSIIPGDEINPLLQLIGNDDVVELSHIFFNNSNIIVTSGPLKGMEGIIIKVDKRKKRAKILLEFLGNKKIVDVGVEVISLPDKRNDIE